jgi:hypothetical protein
VVEVVYKHLYFILKVWYQKHRLAGFETFNFYPYLQSRKAKKSRFIFIYLETL